MDCTIYVAKTKALITCADTAQLIRAFVYTYANGFFNDAAHILQYMFTVSFGYGQFVTQNPHLEGKVN